MASRLTFFAYRSLARFAEVLPSRAVGPLARVAGGASYRLSPSKRRLVADNLGRVLGAEAPSATVRAAFVSYARYWLDAFRLPMITTDQLDGLMSAEGIEHLEAARDAGKGMILALPHMGNWDVAGAWLVERGTPLTVVVERIEPPELFVWFRDFRSTLGLDVVVNGPGVGTSLLAALRRNEAIALLCDRDVDGTGDEVELFGEVTKLPRGPAMLALRTGAALLPVAVVEEGRGYRAVIGAPVDVVRQPGARLADDVRRVTAEVASRTEELIRRAPEQWHLFQPNWPSQRS